MSKYITVFSVAAAVFSAWAIDANYSSFYEGWVNPSEHIIRIGPADMPECSVDVHLSIWENMNELQVWRWVAACVEVKQKQSI